MLCRPLVAAALILATGPVSGVAAADHAGQVTFAGLPVPGATVTVQNVQTNVEATATTNDDGSYSFPVLLPGKYKLVVTKEGFKVEVRDQIEIRVADKLTIDVQLQTGNVSETVTVVANAVALMAGLGPWLAEDGQAPGELGLGEEVGRVVPAADVGQVPDVEAGPPVQPEDGAVRQSNFGTAVRGRQTVARGDRRIQGPFRNLSLTGPLDAEISFEKAHPPVCRPEIRIVGQGRQDPPAQKEPVQGACRQDQPGPSRLGSHTGYRLLWDPSIGPRHDLSQFHAILGALTRRPKPSFPQPTGTPG